MLCASVFAETVEYGVDIDIEFTPSVSPDAIGHRLYYLNLSTGKEYQTEDFRLPQNYWIFDWELFSPDTEYRFTGDAYPFEGNRSGRSEPLYILIGPDPITPPPEPEPEPEPIKPGKGTAPGQLKKR